MVTDYRHLVLVDTQLHVDTQWLLSLCDSCRAQMRIADKCGCRPCGCRHFTVADESGCRQWLLTQQLFIFSGNLTIQSLLTLRLWSSASSVFADAHLKCSSVHLSFNNSVIFATVVSLTQCILDTDGTPDTLGD